MIFAALRSRDAELDDACFQNEELVTAVARDIELLPPPELD